MELLKTLGLAAIGASHEIWILITPMAGCWQAMAFHGALALAACLGGFYALTERLWNRCRQAPSSASVSDGQEFLDTPAGRYMWALRQRGAVL